MWHVLHLAALPAAFLLGVFCVLTSIVLYPGEEGGIQSRFEDFWIWVDDYKKLALSRHAAFMTQVARLETRFLDLVFGHKLFSGQAIIVSCCCAVAFTSLTNSRTWPDQEDRTSWGIALVVSILTASACSALRNSSGLQLVVVVLALTTVAVRIWMVPFRVVRLIPDVNRIWLILVVIMIGGFACDVFFIAMTRRLVRWMVEMTSSLRLTTAIRAEATTYKITSIGAPFILRRVIGNLAPSTGLYR